MSEINKVVLAYSGGLDTSVILKWLQDVYDCEVVTFTADIGQGEELAPARRKARMAGVRQIFIEDLREEFVRDFVFPMFRANAVYEGEYLLGTSIARPLIAKRLVEIARRTDADARSHGATGKGNDQVRVELGAYASRRPQSPRAPNPPGGAVTAPRAPGRATGAAATRRGTPTTERHHPTAEHHPTHVTQTESLRQDVAQLVHLQQRQLAHLIRDRRHLGVRLLRNLCV